MQNNFKFKPAEIGVFSTKNSDIAVSDLGKGSRILGFTRGNFSLIDLIHSVLKKTGPAHVICTTWSAGIKDVHQVLWMQNSEMIKTFKIITDYSYLTRQKRYTASITEIFGEENIRTSDIHSKFTVIYNDDWKITIRTSMNLNANKTCENFEIDEDQGIFDFHIGFIQHTFENMGPGFESDYVKVNKCLDKYFDANTKKISGWYTF